LHRPALRLRFLVPTTPCLCRLVPLHSTAQWDACGIAVSQSRNPESATGGQRTDPCASGHWFSGGQPQAPSEHVSDVTKLLCHLEEPGGGRVCARAGEGHAHHSLARCGRLTRQECSSLHSLSLFGVFNAAPITLAHLLRMCPLVKHLDLYRSCVRAHGKSLPKDHPLASLRLPFFIDRGPQWDLRGLRHLTTLRTNGLTPTSPLVLISSSLWELPSVQRSSPC
jgi:hypothetical protein